MSCFTTRLQGERNQEVLFFCSAVTKQSLRVDTQSEKHARCKESAAGLLPHTRAFGSAAQVCRTRELSAEQKLFVSVTSADSSLCAGEFYQVDLM